MALDGKATYRVGDLLVDLGRGQVTRDGAEIPLPKLSFNLLRALVEAAPNLVTPDELVQRVWPGLVVSPETVSQRVKLLRQSLGDDPREARYVAGIRGRGYRLLAPVELVSPERPIRRQGDRPVAPDATGVVVVAAKPDAAADASVWGSPGNRRYAVLAAGVLVVGAALGIGASMLATPEKATDEAPGQHAATVVRPVLAVLPFVQLGGPDDALSLPDGLQSDILTELSRIPALDVIAATSVEQFRGTTLDARDIGKRLGASHLLEGGVQRVEDRVRINAQLIDTRSQSHVWAATYDRALTTSNLFSVQSEIAVAVADALRVALAGDERGPARAVPTENLDAWALEKAARVQLERRTTESITDADRLFRQAIALDPKFARAYAGLADAVWLRADQQGLPWQPAVAEAERLVNRALRLDDALPEAWTTRAKLAQERHDYETAEAAYRRAFELNPSYARAHAWYSQFLYQLGREKEARAANRRAAELDPLSAPLLVNLGLSVVEPEDPAEALEWMDKASAIDPRGWLGAHGRALVYAFAGRYDEALHWDLQALKLDPQAGYALVGVARRHLELDDLEGATTWFARVEDTDLEIPGSFSHAALVSLYGGEPGRALASARRALAYDPRDPVAFRVLDAEALRRGDIADVVATVRSSFPDLAGPEALRIRRLAVVPATDLALALRRGGDQAASDTLLDGVAAFLETARSGGTVEFVIDEIRVAAIRGDHEGALQALDERVATGWRGEYWRYYRDHDPAFDGLRTDPRFRKAFAAIERDIALQRARAAESGDLGRGPPRADPAP